MTESKKKCLDKIKELSVELLQFYDYNNMKIEINVSGQEKTARVNLTEFFPAANSTKKPAV